MTRDGLLKAIQLRGYSGMGPYRKNTGAIGGIDIYQCPHIESVIYPVYTNKTVSGNFRGPEYPQGYYGIESMMDDVAYKLKMDPVDFILKNMTRKSRDEVPYTNYSLEECMTRGAEAFEWKKRWRSQPGSDPGPVKRGAGMSFMAFRSALGRSNAVIRLDAKRKIHRFRRCNGYRGRRENDDGDHCGRSSGCAALEDRRRLGRHGPLSLFRRRVRQPYDDTNRIRGYPGCGSAQAPNRRKRITERRKRSGRFRIAQSHAGRQGARSICGALRRSRGRH